MTPESNPRKPSHAERLYRRLLRLLPGDFRHDFGDSMAADFADRRRDSAGGARALMLLREFGGLLRALVRQWIGDVGRDLRFAIRLLARTKTVTLAALGMLAVGTGANVAVFSIVDAVMLRTPFDQPERMFFVRMAGGNSGNPTAAIPKALLPALQRLDGLEAVAAVWGGSPTYRGAGIEAHRLNLECVSAGFFAVTGARPLLGRPFAAAEDVASALPIFVASYDFWRRELNSDPKVIGRVLNLDNRPVTIIGVMPRGFNGAYSRNHVDGWAPIGPALNRPGPSGCAVGPFVNVMVRTRSDASVPAIESALTALSNANGAVHPKGALSSVLGDTVDDVRMPLLILMGAVACVLFIACANVANLLVERALGRRRELAMRLALGATRDRVFRQAIVETLALALTGAAAGAALAYFALDLIVGVVPTNVPHVNEIEINGRVLAATVALAIGSGLLVALLPAWQAIRLNVQNGLKDGALGATRTRRHWTRHLLIVAEVGASVVLLVGALLMVRTFVALNPVEPGFDAKNKGVAWLSPRGADNRPFSPDAMRTFVGALIPRIEAVPEVAGVSYTTYVPLSASVSIASARKVDNNDQPTREIYSGSVSANFFTEMSIPLRAGRTFGTDDGAGAPMVAVISETMARQFWGDRSPIGARIETDLGTGPVVRTVVGIVGDIRSENRDPKPRPIVYWPYLQDPGTFVRLVIRARASLTPDIERRVRAAVNDVDSRQIVSRFDRYDAILAGTMQGTRFGLTLLGTFATLAVTLAAVGLAAVVGWMVTERRREIGVRVALGANRREILRPFVRRGLVLGAFGVILGLSAAAWASRVMASWVFGVKPLDPPTFTMVAIGVMLIAWIGSWWPARQATRIDPIRILREE